MLSHRPGAAYLDDDDDDDDDDDEEAVAPAPVAEAPVAKTAVPKKAVANRSHRLSRRRYGWPRRKRRRDPHPEPG